MLSSKQQEYLASCNHRWNIKIGATGSGKTWLDYAVVIPKRVMAMKGEGEGLLLGNTMGSIKRNVLDPMRDLWGKALVGNVRSNDGTVRLFGRKVYVMGADKANSADRIQGMTVEYAYGDEMTTWSERIFQMLKSRLRCEHSHFDGTANPASPAHFIKGFIDSGADIYCQKSTIFDNPFLTKDFVDNLCMEYEGTVYYKRYILGEWALAEGLIYPMYEDAIGTVSFEDPEDDFEAYRVSCDYGTQNAFAAIMWALYRGVWYAIDEYYYSGRDTGVQKTDEEYADDLDKFTADARAAEGERGQKLAVIIDPSAASFIALLKKRSGYKVRKAKNEVADGIRETATVMRAGKIKISPVLKNWLKEAAGYRWDEAAGDDKPIKENDHAMDAMRYFVKTEHIARIRREYR